MLQNLIPLQGINNVFSELILFVLSFYCILFFEYKKTTFFVKYVS